jgi:hypothetical protein
MPPITRVNSILTMMLVTCVLAPTRAAPATQSASAPGAAEALVARLGDERWVERDRAARALSDMHEDARVALTAGLTSNDPEVAAASESLLGRLHHIAVRKGLRLVLTAAATAVCEGDAIALTATFRNNGPTLVKIVLPVDGCDLGWRAVSYDWNITRGHGVLPPLRMKTMRCGNVNSYCVEDIVTLAPGQSYSVFGHERSFLSHPSAIYRFPPGEHQITLTYRYARGAADRGGIRTPSAADALWEALEIELVSDPIEIRVVPKPHNLLI